MQWRLPYLLGSPLNCICQRMDVQLSDLNWGMALDTRQSDNVAAGIGELGQGCVPENVGLDVPENVGLERLDLFQPIRFGPGIGAVRL
jgi:hypothetical protein